MKGLISLLRARTLVSWLASRRTISVLGDIGLVRSTGAEGVPGSTAAIDATGQDAARKEWKRRFDVEIDRQGEAVLPTDGDPINANQALQKASVVLRSATAVARRGPNAARSPRVADPVPVIKSGVQSG